MEIKLKELTVRDVVDSYQDLGESGITGYGGSLNIRPKYQREFVYNDKQRAEVINTIMQGFPLNTMYWMKSEDGTHELLDGQQRTISFCQYVDGVYSFKNRYFHNLTQDEKDAILDYPLFIYECEGTDSERLSWFRVINIAGEKLTDQELRNAVYTGPWLTSAKSRFSKSNCVADQLAGDLMLGSPIRQDYLEEVLSWAANKDGVDGVDEYMAIHQHDDNANALWQYFRAVHVWVTGIFPTYNKLMKGLPWGIYYNTHKDDDLDPATLEPEVQRLIKDEDVTKKRGIYAYLLDGDERHLSIRAFTDNQRQEAYARQEGLCANCGDPYQLDEMHADHLVPWSDGGKTTAENCLMLCRQCNWDKGAQ